MKSDKVEKKIIAYFSLLCILVVSGFAVAKHFNQTNNDIGYVVDTNTETQDKKIFQMLLKKRSLILKLMN